MFEHTNTHIADLKSDKLNPIHVYPNPTDGVLMISSEGEAIENLELYSTLGQLVWQQNNIWTTNTQLSTTTLPQGVYVLKITRAGKVYSQKVWVIK